MRIQVFLCALFFGSMWGIMEAVLGFALHFLHLPSGAVMFPIGLFFMYQAYKKSSYAPSVLMTAIVAAGVKGIDLLLTDATFRPMMAIIAEGLVVFIVTPLVVNNNNSNKFLKVYSLSGLTFLTAVTWRVLFVSTGIPKKWLTTDINLLASNITQFFFYEPLYNTIVVALCYGIMLFISAMNLNSLNFINNKVSKLINNSAFCGFVFLAALTIEYSIKI